MHGHLTITRVNVRKLAEVQVLFAFDGEELAGLLIFSCLSYNRLDVIHIAVGEHYSCNGKFANKLLAMRLSQQLRNCARQIKHIDFIRVIYGGDRGGDYRVKRNSHSRSHLRDQYVNC